MKPKNLNPIFSLRLSSDHLKLLDLLSEQIGVSRTDVIRLALQELSSKTLKKHVAKR